MSIIGKIVGLFTTDTVAWTKGINSATKDVDGLEKKTKSFLSGLSDSFGKRSSLGQLTKLAVGGGAIAGLSFAARELDKFTEKIVAMQLESGKADHSFDDYAVEIAKALPIIGSITDAVENVLKVATGQAKQEAETKAIIDDQNAAFQKRNEIIKAGAEEQKRLAETFRKAHEERVINATPEGEARDKTRSQFETSDKLRSLAEEFKSGSSFAEIAETKKQLAALKGKDDDLSLRKAAELNQQLAVLQRVYNQELKTYQAARAEIIAGGSEKIQQITDTAAAKEAAKQQEQFDKEKEALDRQQKEKAEIIDRNLKHLAERGKQITDANNPLTAYMDKIKELDVLFAAKAIDRQGYAAAAKKALHDYDDAAAPKGGEYRAAESHVRRSADIVTATPKLANPLNDLNKKAADALAEHRKANGYLSDIADAAKGEVPVNF